MSTEPFIPKQPNDLIRAADWNQIQTASRKEVQTHNHSGAEQGVQLDSAAIADGAITEAKLSMPFDIQGHRLRPGIDELALDWNWTLDIEDLSGLDDFEVGATIDKAIIRILQPRTDLFEGAIDEAVNQVMGSSAMSEDVRKAMSLLCGVLDPTAVLSTGAAPTYDQLSTTATAAALNRVIKDADNITAITADALDRINVLWEAAQGFDYPNLLFAVATMPRVLLQRVLDNLGSDAGLGGLSGQTLLTNLISEPFTSHLFEMVAASMMRPLGDDVGDGLPHLVDLPAISYSGDDGAYIGIVEVEVEALVRTSNMSILAIGGIEAPPPLHRWMMTRRAGVDGGDRGGSMLRLRQRIPVFAGERRQLRLWGVACDQPNFGNQQFVAFDQLSSFSMRARTVGFQPNSPADFNLGPVPANNP